MSTNQATAARCENKTRQKSLANWLRSFPPTVTSFRKNRVPRRCRQHQFSMTLERSGQYVSLIWLVSHPTGTAARYLVQTHTYNSYTTEDNKFYSLSSCCCWNWRNTESSGKSADLIGNTGCQTQHGDLATMPNPPTKAGGPREHGLGLRRLHLRAHRTEA